MPRRPRSRCLLVVTALVAGCGSSHHTSQTSTSQSGKSKLPLSAYLVRRHEETGLPPTGGVTVYRTAAQWTSDGVPDAAAEDNRLAQEGFREVMSVQTGSTQGQGVSWVMELNSASAPAPEKAAELHEFAYGPDAPTTPTRFTVPGVPSAEGWTFPNADANVLFTEGRCLMLVGDQLASATDNRPPVIAAVRAVWTRTHDKPGACST
jgi:hypothetical protein